MGGLVVKTTGKRCNRCGVVKLYEDFYRYAPAKDGLQRVCKPCHIEANRRSALRHPETRAAAAARRPREARLARSYAWKAANRDKVRAHDKVLKALRSGKLTRPDRCERCGDEERQIVAHHEDFARPLDVVWLCVPCHCQRLLERAEEEAR
jgi:hypothetical protein